MNTMPPTMLPRVTGIKLAVKKWLKVMSAPRAIPMGIKNMFATLCSRPMATKAQIGGHRPRILPGRLLAAPAHHTATHTSQLARMARMKAYRETQRQGSGSHRTRAQSHLLHVLICHTIVVGPVSWSKWFMPYHNQMITCQHPGSHKCSLDGKTVVGPKQQCNLSPIHGQVHSFSHTQGPMHLLQCSCTAECQTHGETVRQGGHP